MQLGEAAVDNSQVHTLPFEWVQTAPAGFQNFAIVRHPLARLYSLYNEKIRCAQRTGGLDTHVFGEWLRYVHEQMTFDEFVDFVVSIPPTIAEAHFAPQSLLLPADTKIIKMEQAGLLLQTCLPIVNNCPYPMPWRKAYSARSRQLAVNYYADCFQRFGYDVPLPTTILVDCDGCLTSGSLTINRQGTKLFKSFHTRDVRAIRELVQRGFEVYIVTADDCSSIAHFADKVGAVVHVARDKGSIPFDDYIAIGDDAWDIPMLRRAAVAFAPSDAYIGVLNLPNTQPLKTAGGRGVMAEVLDQLTQHVD